MTALEYSEIALQEVREGRLLLTRLDDWLYGEIAPYIGQRVLEIGCGLGNLAHRMTQHELYIGTDVDEQSVAAVQNAHHAHSNMLAYVADVTQPEFVALSRFNVDTIVSFNAFEHIQDHILALQNATQVLATGGHLILIVPAHQVLYGTMDRSIGHYRRYDKQIMSQAFSQVGLTPVELKYINLAGALGWFINGRVLKRETPPRGQLRLFNALVPVFKRVEHLVGGAPLGLSLLAVGVKK